MKNTDTVTVDIDLERNETMLIIKNATYVHEGYYQCMATNEVSSNVTRAKFQLSSSSADAQVERTYAEPKAPKPKKVRKIVRRKIELPAPAKVIVEVAKEADVTTTTTTSTTSASTSSSSTIQVTQVIEEEHIEIHEEIEEIRVKIHKELVSEKDLRTFKMANEVNEILQLIEAHKFGTGEQPLRELATIGYLVQRGITVTEITSLYNADTFPALQNPEAQAALVQMVERRGHGALISEVLTEETTVDDEHLFASTVGFTAFMRMIQREHYTIEEVITHFKEEDFVQHEWKHAEARETTVTSHEVISVGK